MNRLFATAVGLLFAGAASAAPLAYECTLKEYGSSNAVPEKAIFVVDTQAKTAMAYDGYIHHVEKAPKAVSYKALSDTKYLMKWTLNGIPGRSNRRLVATYTARLDVGRMKASMDVRLHGADNEIQGSGSCKAIKL